MTKVGFGPDHILLSYHAMLSLQGKRLLILYAKSFGRFSSPTNEQLHEVIFYSKEQRPRGILGLVENLVQLNFFDQPTYILSVNKLKMSGEMLKEKNDTK